MLRVLSRQAFGVIRANYSSASAGGQVLNEELKKRIDGLVKASDVVVFMKGTQQEPMCGFSKNVKLVLDFHNIKFNDHNVLADAELREGIKVYSDWPTIPQVYVKGEFVGGCDIMISMHKDGEISDFFDEKNIPNKYGKK
ncbi:unnamed protein product [Caenorhabditis angaria]|uniref:Glutaredoxin-related protein 5, mitochondrial n=1 Tax=Caenorhabditis angaria TaxID=860376 RepID=A0A9P1IL54_9PELO|nr:unnamed protein product [Caenorhabditis angaria]